jgi:hypothetical protein
VTKSNKSNSRTGRSLEEYGGDDETRTRDLCRDSLAGIGFTTTYKNAGTAKIPVSRTRLRILWVGLWVGNLNAAYCWAVPAGFTMSFFVVPTMAISSSCSLAGTLNLSKPCRPQSNSLR